MGVAPKRIFQLGEVDFPFARRGHLDRIYARRAIYQAVLNESRIILNKQELTLQHQTFTITREYCRNYADTIKR